jgi:hypothetical protein
VRVSIFIALVIPLFNELSIHLGSKENFESFLTIYDISIWQDQLHISRRAFEQHRQLAPETLLNAALGNFQYLTVT